MFRFEHPEFVWFAGLLFVLLMAVILRRRLGLRNWAKWGSEASNQKIRSLHLRNPRLLLPVLLAAMLLSISAVNPQWGFKTVTVENKSAVIYLLLDISNSMLAEDIAPSRLERARRLGLDLSNAFRTDKVGLILFAGNAYMQSPLTTDWNAIQIYLNAAHPDQAGTQGTAIGEAVRLALGTKDEDEDIAEQGAMIILTDGEDHDSDAPSAIEEAASAGWITYIVGVGTETGGTIPIAIDGRKDLKRDETGQPVKTSMNRTLMTQLAQQGNGKYYDLTDGDVIIENLKKELANLDRTQQEKRSFSEHRSYYQWFLLPAILLIFLGAFVNYKYDLV